MKTGVFADRYAEYFEFGLQMTHFVNKIIEVTVHPACQFAQYRLLLGVNNRTARSALIAPTQTEPFSQPGINPEPVWTCDGRGAIAITYTDILPDSTFCAG